MSLIAIERYTKYPEQHPNRRCAGIKESYPEKMFKDFLITNNLKENQDFIQQYKIEKFFVDFYFPKINLGVEIDGERWHNKEDEREINRELFIKTKIDLIRFTAKEITSKSKENEIVTKIFELLKE